MRQAEPDNSIRACSSFTLVHSGKSACTAPSHGDKPAYGVNEAKLRSRQIAFPCWSFHFGKLHISGFGAKAETTGSCAVFSLLAGVLSRHESHGNTLRKSSQRLMQVVKSFLIRVWRPGATLLARRERQTKADEAFLGVHQRQLSWSRGMSSTQTDQRKC